MLLRQGYDVDALLRLLAGEVRITNAEGQAIAYSNRPSDQDGYPVFRRVMTHLSAIQDHHALYIEPLLLQQRWLLPASAMTVKGFQALSQETVLTYDAAQQMYQVAKRVTGRILLTNYDRPCSRTRNAAVAGRGGAGPINEVLVDIRPGYPGSIPCMARSGCAVSSMCWPSLVAISQRSLNMRCPRTGVRPRSVRIPCIPCLFSKPSGSQAGPI